MIHFQFMLSFELNLLIHIYFVVISLKYCTNDEKLTKKPRLDFPTFQNFLKIHLLSFLIIIKTIELCVNITLNDSTIAMANKLRKRIKHNNRT